MSSENKAGTPITTRSGMSLGRNLFKLVVPYLSPQDSQQDSDSIKDEQSMAKESSVDGHKLEKQNACSTDDIKLDKIVADMNDPGSKTNESLISTSDMFKLDISSKVYEESDEDWPVREALIFRYLYLGYLKSVNFNLDSPYITFFSYDFGPSNMHPSDFIKSCNDVAIGHALKGRNNLQYFNLRFFVSLNC